MTYWEPLCACLLQSDTDKAPTRYGKFIIGDIFVAHHRPPIAYSKVGSVATLLGVNAEGMKELQ